MTDQKNSGGSFRSPGVPRWRSVFIAVILLTITVVASFIIYDRFGIHGFILFSLAIYFPIAQIAYVMFQRPIKLSRFREDIGLLGLKDVEATARFEKHFGLLNYTLHGIPTLLFTAIGAALLLNFPIIEELFQFISPNAREAMRFGFLGAYIFSIQLVYRRYITLDLQPTVFMYCTQSLASGLILNFVAFEAIDLLTRNADTAAAAATGLGAGAIAILAFSLGYFPNLAIRWFNRLTNSALGFRERRSAELSLNLIDGISPWHENRLLDNGIDNIQNLASADILDLLVSTTFSAQQVIDWVDQAILYVYLEPSDIENFRRAMAVRTASDFKDQLKRSPREHEALAQQLQMRPERLEALSNSVQRGPNSHYVVPYWGNADRLAAERRKSSIEEGLLNILKKAPGQRYNPSVAPIFDAVEDLLSEFSGDLETAHCDSVESLVGLGDLHAKNNRYDEALDVYREAISIYPDNALAHNQLAWLYVDQSNDEAKYQEAVILAEQAVFLSEQQNRGAPNPAFLDTLGVARMKLGDYDHAERLLNRARQSQDLPDYGAKIVNQHLAELKRLRQQNNGIDKGSTADGQASQSAEIPSTPQNP